MIYELNSRIDPAKASGDYDPVYLLSLILDIGEELLGSGAEIDRVEDSLFRIVSAYGFTKINVFSIPEFLSISFTDHNGEIITQTRRVYKSGNNMKHLEDLNGLSREICNNKMTVQEIYDCLEGMEPNKYEKSAILNAVAYYLASGGFAVFFGGTIVDGLVSGVSGVFIYLINRYSKMQHVNKIVYTGIASFLAGFFALLLYVLGLGDNLDKIIIGNIMLLVPGLALTTSFSDMLSGDIVAGLIKFLESVLVAGAIAIGYAIPLYFLGGIM